MAAQAVPSFQTKSKRNMFADAPVAPIVTQAENEEKPIPSTDDSKNQKENESPLSCTTSKNSLSPKSVSSSPGKKSKSPRKSPRKSPKSAGGFFSFFSGWYGSNGTKRPVPVATGVYFDYRTDDVSVKTTDTVDSENVYVPIWVASNLDTHHRGVPSVVRRPEYEKYNEADDQKLLAKVMAKARKLPREPGKYASNHIMINADRMKRNIPPLRRERHMDQIAREHAKLMAEEKTLFHIDNPKDLANRLKEKDRETNELPVFERLGMNISRGKNVLDAHRSMMAALAERNNIQDKRFFSMGMGAITADNGVIYLCQIFGGC